MQKEGDSEGDSRSFFKGNLISLVSCYLERAVHKLSSERANLVDFVIYYQSDRKVQQEQSALLSKILIQILSM